MGLMLACQLQRRGVSYRLLETRPRRDYWCKALGVSPRPAEATVVEKVVAVVGERAIWDVVVEQHAVLHPEIPSQAAQARDLLLLALGRLGLAGSKQYARAIDPLEHVWQRAQEEVIPLVPRHPPERQDQWPVQPKVVLRERATCLGHRVEPRVVVAGWDHRQSFHWGVVLGSREELGLLRRGGDHEVGTRDDATLLGDPMREPEARLERVGVAIHRIPLPCPQGVGRVDMGQR